MNIAPLSASKMERVAACTASVLLPSYPHTTKIAIAGTERHSDVEEEKPTAYPIVLPNMEHEVAYLIDPKKRTVKRIGAGMPRAYGHDRPWYTVGTTLDVESVTEDRAEAVDAKSRKRVTAAKRNWQVRLQALALWETYHLPVRSGLHYLDNGEKDYHDFTRFDHAATWADLERVIATVESAYGSTPTPHMGPWCEYCESILACPAVNAALRGMLDYALSGDSLPNTVTAAEAGALHPVLKAIKAKYDRMWEALRLRAKTEPLPLGNGKHLRLIENARGSLVLTERKDEDNG